MVRYVSPMMRSAIWPVSLILGFSLILVAVNLLGQPVSPARKQHFGWQSWDVVNYPRPSSPEAPTSAAMDHSGSENSTDMTVADWELDDGTAPSLPLDNWDPLAWHTTGITEITVASCLFKPSLYPSLCAPKSTVEEDKLKGKWVRVDRDLNAKTGLWYLNVYYRRTRRLDVPLITDLLYLPDGSAPPPNVDLSQYVRANGNFRDGVWPTQTAMRVWYKVQGPNYLGGAHMRAGSGLARARKADARGYSGAESQKRDEWDAEGDEEAEIPGGIWVDEDSVITEIDVLYGPGPAFFGFDRIPNGPLVQTIPNKYDAVDIVVRKGNPEPIRASPPRFHSDGTFKIMQIADLHFSVGNGVCRDTTKSPCTGDPDSLILIAQALDAERPDLVVFSGDQLNGQGSSWDSKSVIAKYLEPVLTRGIAWTAIFGNHDSEIADDRAFQMRLLEHLPHSLARAGPSDVDGVGNYVVKIFSGDASYIHLFTLYFLDSHARQAKKLPWLEADYDYLKPSQIEWFLNESAHIDPIIRPFTPDGADDLGHIWRRSTGGKRLPAGKDGSGTTLAKPNAMMWFHIPVEESYGPVDEFGGQPLDIGNQAEGDYPGNSKTNGGFFEGAIQQALAVPVEEQEEADLDGETPGRRLELVSVNHGHCHNTDKCRRVKGVYMCFDGGSSYSGYGRLEFDRRFRVFSLSNYGETVETYKWTESGQRVDREVLAGKGAPGSSTS